MGDTVYWRSFFRDFLSPQNKFSLRLFGLTDDNATEQQVSFEIAENMRNESLPHDGVSYGYI